MLISRGIRCKRRLIFVTLSRCAEYRVAVLFRIFPSRWTPQAMRNRFCLQDMDAQVMLGMNARPVWLIIFLKIWGNNNRIWYRFRMWCLSRWKNSEEYCDSHALHNATVSRILSVSCNESYAKSAQTVNCFPASSVPCVHDVRRLIKIGYDAIKFWVCLVYHLNDNLVFLPFSDLIFTDHYSSDRNYFIW